MFDDRQDPDREHRHPTCVILKKKACRRQALKVQGEHQMASQAWDNKYDSSYHKYKNSKLLQNRILILNIPIFVETYIKDIKMFGIIQTNQAF
jgi:hypothetical protein